MKYNLIKSSIFSRKASKLIKSHPELINIFKQKLMDLSENPFTNNLRTHKLKGQLSDSWACSLTYEYRIILKIIDSYKLENEQMINNVIFLETIGTHDEVY